MTDGTFEEIAKDEEEVVGPPAILVSGYGEEAEPALQGLLEKVGCRQHKVLRCSPAMVEKTLQQALETTDGEEPAAPDELPRAAILSGLTGAQLHLFLDGFSTTGLPRPIFAAVTEANLTFSVRDLLVELLREDRAMRAKK